MNLIFRLIRVMLHACFRSKLGALDESQVRFRVLPNDLDLNFHMNNGRYLTLMDLGRIDYFVRCGIAGLSFKRKWQPIVGSEMIRFKKSLSLFQPYTLHTRAKHWDEKWFYLEQVFMQNGKVAAVGHIKGLLRGKEGNIPPVEVLRALGLQTNAPGSDAYLKTWKAVDEVLSASR